MASVNSAAFALTSLSILPLITNFVSSPMAVNVVNADCISMVLFSPNTRISRPCKV